MQLQFLLLSADRDFLGATSAAEFELPIDAPIRLKDLSARPVQVTWFALPLSELHVRAWFFHPPDNVGGAAKACGFEVQHGEDSGELVIAERPGHCPLTDIAVRIGVPFHILERHQAWAIFPPESTQRTTACSDGHDNDGDGLADAVDPGCDSMEDDDEANPVEPSNFKFKLESDSYGGAYFAQLTWKGKKVVTDDGTQGSRFYLHNDRSSETNYTSGLQWFPESAFPFFPRFYDMDFPMNPPPHNFTPHIGFKPWYPGSKLGENYTLGGVNDPLWSVPKGRTRTTIKSQTSTGAVLETDLPDALITDTITFYGDTMLLTTNITSRVQHRAMASFPGLTLGNLQVGTGHTSNCNCTPHVTVFSSGKDDLSGFSQAGNCSIGTGKSTCSTGLFHLNQLRAGSVQQGQPWATDTVLPPSDPSELTGWKSMAARGWSYPGIGFSPATALGDTKSFTLGMQTVVPGLNPDHMHEQRVEYYDIPAAPKHPMLSVDYYILLDPGGSKSFQTFVQLGEPAADWADPRPQIRPVLQPYATFFEKTYGGPVYCPGGAFGWGFEAGGPCKGSACNASNPATPWNASWPPGSTLWTDDLQADGFVSAAANASRISKALIWEGFLQSNFLDWTGGGGADFSPNGEVMDPNLDASCNDTVFLNVTDGLRKKGVELGWYIRAGRHIMRTDDPSKPASIECPSKRVHKGMSMICNMTRMVHGEEPDDCTKANIKMIDTLVSRGIHDYYWDEYWEQPGRMTFTHLMRSKHPEIGYIMAEQCDDVDSVLVAPLLWDAMPQTTWDPGFEPMSNALLDIVNPFGETVAAMIGGMGLRQHISYHLNASRGANYAAEQHEFPQGPCLNGTWDGASCGPHGVHRPVTKQPYNDTCSDFIKANANAQWRWAHYGKAKGCPAVPQLDLVGMGCA